MSERKRKSVDEEARSTDRPPAPTAEELERELASAIRAAKGNTSPGRYGPPAATSKIGAFDLAQALALSSGDRDPASTSPDKPLRDDDAPFAAPDVEVVGEEEIPSGVPGLSSKPPSKSPKSTHPSSLAVEPNAVATAPAAPRSYTGLVLLALVVGVAMMAYVYMYTNR